MVRKKIIACLDIKNGRTVKGVNFISLVDAGDPVELAKAYVEQGADELVFLDINATVENRKTLTDLVQKVAKEINIPFTVGGGISSIDDASAVIDSGANKISISSSAVKNPKLIEEIAKKFGSQKLVVAIDTNKEAEGWKVYTHGGRTLTSLTTVDWAKEVESYGAGEILLTSMSNDGAKNGFALDITKAVAQAVTIPVTASGGAGTMEHFYEVFTQTQASAGLAASIFHFNEISIPELKQYLIDKNIPIQWK